MTASDAKKKIWFWGVMNVIVVLLPYIPLLIWKWKDYFGHKDGFNNMIGIVFMALFIVVALMKMSKKLKVVVGSWILFVAFYFMESMLTDLINISMCNAAGLSLYILFTNAKKDYWLGRFNKLETAEDNASANKKAIKEVMEEYKEAIDDGGRG